MESSSLRVFNLICHEYAHLNLVMTFLTIFRRFRRFPKVTKHFRTWTDTSTTTTTTTTTVIAKYRDLWVSLRSIICLGLRLRQIIDLLAADKSRYFAQPRSIINNYSPKWRWIVVDIHRAAKRRGKYPPLSPTLRWIINYCFSIYHTSWITSGPKSNFTCENIATKAILFFSGCSEVNSTWLITSELANQRARKVLFTYVVYTNC